VLTGTLYSEQVVNYALSRRPNVRLVETGLPFGKPGFTSYMGKEFHQSLKLTRRFYPHTYNVDGFYVAKFQKVGPTPPNAVLANDAMNKEGGKKSKSGVATEDDDGVDRTPIAADGKAEKEDDDFGGFDEEEDEKYIDRAKRNAMRRRGLDPRALNRKGSREGKGLKGGEERAEKVEKAEKAKKAKK
jgi:25S rRNA (cytosine2870-C5)-methyltransferase